MQIKSLVFCLLAAASGVAAGDSAYVLLLDIIRYTTFHQATS